MEFPLQARPVAVSDEGDFIINPSAKSSHTDFDFLHGRHSVVHRRLTERLIDSQHWVETEGHKVTEPILENHGNIERHYLTSLYGEAVEAIALRLFDPATQLWSLNWADSINLQLDFPLKGSFENEIGVFFGKDWFKGQEIFVQFQYDKTHPGSPVWGQAFSADKGKSWEWNWFMFFRRVDG